MRYGIVSLVVLRWHPIYTSREPCRFLGPSVKADELHVEKVNYSEDHLPRDI